MEKPESLENLIDFVVDPSKRRMQTIRRSIICDSIAYSRMIFTRRCSKRCR